MQNQFDTHNMPAWFCRRPRGSCLTSTLTPRQELVTSPVTPRNVTNAASASRICVSWEPTVPSAAGRAAGARCRRACTCVGSAGRRSPSGATYVSMATCTARRSTRARHVDVASAGRRTSRCTAPCAARGWPRQPQRRRRRRRPGMDRRTASSVDGVAHYARLLVRTAVAPCTVHDTYS